MNDVPKFVRQRMAQLPISGDHPDGNLLVAFAEGGLTGREREQVLTHLGVCDACRETVSLAVPEIATPVTHATPSGTRWMRWPMLRWAGVAAAVVIVAAAVLIQNSRRAAEFSKPSVARVAKPQVTGPPASSATVNEIAPSLDESAKAELAAPRRDTRTKGESWADKQSTAIKKDAFSANNAYGAPTLAIDNAPSQMRTQSQSSIMTQQARPQAAPTKGATISDFSAMDEKQQQQASAPTQQLPSATESVEISGQADAVEAQAPAGQEQRRSEVDSVIRRPAAPRVNGRATATREQGATGVPTSAAAAAGLGPAMMKTKLILSPQWRLSAEGALERSTDAGSTWQLVQVAAKPARLRSLSVVGREIWAAGNGGALYHSGDNGRTWTRVVVKAGDVALDSDIMRVEFADAQRGALKAASGETWTTDDAGTTWSVRR